MTHPPASRLVVGTPDTITHLLAQPSWPEWDAAVIMLSRLMAADSHVIATAAAKLPIAKTARRDVALRRLDLERSLVALHGRAHGDASVSGLDPAAVQRRALIAAGEYLAARDDLAREVLAGLDDEAATALADRWSAALADGATRPHPWLTGKRAQGAIGFHWARFLDRMRDTLDSRPTARRAA